jgi:hypothetical protein
VELEVALTVKAASPKVWLGTVNAMVGVVAVTVKVVFLVVAA